MRAKDPNAILVKSLKSRKSSEITTAFISMQTDSQQAGCCPKYHIMDNEASKEVKDYLKKENIKFQLVPPQMDRANAVENAIGAFEDHFITGLALADENFPLHL